MDRHFYHDINSVCIFSCCLLLHLLLHLLLQLKVLAVAAVALLHRSFTNAVTDTLAQKMLEGNKHFHQCYT